MVASLLLYLYIYFCKQVFEVVKINDIPINDVKNSGAELPAAINVAPATSSFRFNSKQYKKEVHPSKILLSHVYIQLSKIY